MYPGDESQYEYEYRMRRDSMKYGMRRMSECSDEDLYKANLKNKELERTIESMNQEIKQNAVVVGSNNGLIPYDDNCLPVASKSKFNGKLVMMADGGMGTEKQAVCATFWDIIGLKNDPVRWSALLLLVFPLLCYGFTFAKMRSGIEEVALLQMVFLIGLIVKTSFLSVLLMLRPAKWCNRGWRGLWYNNGNGFNLSAAGWALVWSVAIGSIFAIAMTFDAPNCGC